MYEYIRTQEVLLDIKNVGLSFGPSLILRDVNAQVTKLERNDCIQGEVICFLGPSGIGKTQLSRIIAGLQVPTTGSVTLRRGPTGRGKVCMVPQHYPMFEYATVAGNLEIAGKMGGLTKEAMNLKASGYIETFGLKDYLAHFPKALSGGTRQRVAIARQLMCATNYMVMDEPFSGLDPIMKKKATQAITTLAQMDAYNTIIIVTHDIVEGLSCADTVWLMGYERVDGVCVPGAKLVEQYDLANMGLAWRPDLDKDTNFRDFVRLIRDRFTTLR